MNYRDTALRAFCKLRRLQEANDNGYVRCITCGRIVKWNNCDGGHFIDRRHRGTELEPDNVWPQCMVCNRFMSGDKNEYRMALALKIGEERLGRLLKLKTFDHSHKDYQSLAKAFNSESCEIRRKKGI